MELRVIVAILRSEALEAVEGRLRQSGVQGITVTKSKGYGAHPNFFARDWKSDCIRIEIFVEAAAVDRIVETIIDAAHTGQSGDGLVAVLPVENTFSVRSRSESIPNRVGR